jgi:hypothetical protein
MEDLRGMRCIDVHDVVRMARDRGFIVGKVVMDKSRLISFCHVLGFKAGDVIDVLERS